MKKAISAILAAIICTMFLLGCQNGEAGPTAPGESPETVRVAALKGPTAMGMVKLMDDSEAGKTGLSYQFTIGTTDAIVPQITKGELDIAAVPANLASVLYNNTEGKIKVLTINTLGVIYLVEKGESISSVSGLAGKTIYSTGKGATPEYSLNYVLSQNGIDPESGVNVEYKSEAAEIIPLLAQSENGIALLPQPFVATALNKVPGLRIALDWTEEWDKVSGGESGMVTGTIVVRSEFLEKYPDAVATFLEEYAASTKFAQDNVEENAALVGKYEIVDAEIAKQALPYCNITCITGENMKNTLSGYLKVLFEQNPQSVGGKMPDDAFYYAEK